MIEFNSRYNDSSFYYQISVHPTKTRENSTRKMGVSLGDEDAQNLLRLIISVVSNKWIFIC
jgi:hypothetical protein